MEYAKIVAEKSALRPPERAAAEITAMIREGPGDFDAILESAEQKICAVRKGRDAKGMVPVKEILPGVLDRIGEMSESETHLPGLSATFRDYPRDFRRLTAKFSRRFGSLRGSARLRRQIRKTAKRRP